MRPLCLLLLLTLVMQEARGQPVKATPSQFNCETLCAELFASIRANPEKMVMRIEEALVINEACAVELVTTAITAVNGEPARVRLIQETAMEVAPARRAVILAAVRDYRAPVVATAAPVAVVEIRRAELPDVSTKPLPGEEIRRAQLPETILVQEAVPVIDLMSVPKARRLD